MAYVVFIIPKVIVTPHSDLFLTWFPVFLLDLFSVGR